MINEKSKLFVKERIFLFGIVKRLIDIFGSIFLLVLFSPLMLLTAVLIKLTSPGPIIFIQKRVGKNSHQFKMYKFRTMHTGNNDQRLQKYPELWTKYKQSGWKLSLKEDPRVTPVGRIIRSLTLDEFPQLFNVLKGDMTLVGPRAYREEELCEYEKLFPETKKYITDIRSVKPGITGLWQTSGRNELSFEQRARLDSDYIRNRSMRQELFILLKTPFSMLSRW